MLELDGQDLILLTKVQSEFPLCSRPFKALGESMELTEARVIRRLQRLRHLGVLRQLSAIFDSRRLGYGSVLVAAHVPVTSLAEGARRLGRHAGVSHSYERDHFYNLWFTLATPPGVDVEFAATELSLEALASAWHVMPALRTFKIGVKLDLTSSEAPAGSVDAPGSAPVAHASEKAVGQGAALLTEMDRQCIRALQEDLPLVEHPFSMLAQRLDVSEEQLFDWMADAGRRGFLRRFAAVLRHREAGFKANGMGVWTVPEARVEHVARLFAAHPAVTHCYQRATFSDWPYNVFTMVHGHSHPEVEGVLDDLARASGMQQRGVLYSTREFKKERVKYFLEETLVGGAP